MSILGDTPDIGGVLVPRKQSVLWLLVVIADIAGPCSLDLVGRGQAAANTAASLAEWSEVIGMRCPYCRHGDSRVVDSREADDGQIIRRRRSCPQCGKRFTTVEEAILAVVKRSGVTEPFSRNKIMSGVRKACQGRPVDDDALAVLAQRVEESIRARGVAEVPSNEVGLAILGPLRELDEVAYLRFASVYRSFESLADFEREIAVLRRPLDGAGLAENGESTNGRSPVSVRDRADTGPPDESAGGGGKAPPVRAGTNRVPAGTG
jgi:transcriptional repressor NrdR